MTHCTKYGANIFKLRNQFGGHCHCLKTFSKCISTGKALQADCASMITKNDKYVSTAVAPSSVSRGVINNSHLLIKLTWHLVSLLIRTIDPHCGCRCGEALKSHWPAPLAPGWSGSENSLDDVCIISTHCTIKPTSVILFSALQGYWTSRY